MSTENNVFSEFPGILLRPGAEKACLCRKEAQKGRFSGVGFPRSIVPEKERRGRESVQLKALRRPAFLGGGAAPPRRAASWGKPRFCRAGRSRGAGRSLRAAVRGGNAEAHNAGRIPLHETGSMRERRFSAAPVGMAFGNAAWRIVSRRQGMRGGKSFLRGAACGRACPGLFLACRAAPAPGSGVPQRAPFFSGARIRRGKRAGRFLLRAFSRKRGQGAPFCGKFPKSLAAQRKKGFFLCVFGACFFPEKRGPA